MPEATRARRAALVLLLLTLHAAQAGATHFPRPAQAATTQASRDLSSVWNCEADASADTGAHAQCLLCRLQRSLSAGLKNSAPVAFTPPQDSLLVESAAADAPHAPPAGVARGRAPPRS